VDPLLLADHAHDARIGRSRRADNFWFRHGHSPGDLRDKPRAPRSPSETVESARARPTPPRTNSDGWGIWEGLDGIKREGRRGLGNQSQQSAFSITRLPNWRRFVSIIGG